MKKGYILFNLGVIFILSAFSMIYYNNYENNKSKNKVKEINTKIEQVINNEEYNEIIDIDGYDYIGTINIPSINIELPIMKDWDNAKMKEAACKYYGSIHTNNLVLCAHSYKNLFGKLKDLNINDVVIITDLNNVKYYYEVKEIEVLSPKEVKEMIETDFDLTLYTCTTDSLNRLTVRLERIN